MALTDDEKARVRYHLGYVGVKQAFTFVLGIGAAVPYQSIAEGNFDRLLPETEPIARMLIARCDATESQAFEDQDLLSIEQIGEIRVDSRMVGKRRNAYTYWRAALANCFSTVPNPFDMRFMEGGVNVPVVG